MKQITSSDFRAKYASLEEPHEVTALGRVIGVWYPGLRSTGPALMDASIEASGPPGQKSFGQFRPAPKPVKKK